MIFDDEITRQRADPWQVEVHLLGVAREVNRVRHDITDALVVLIGNEQSAAGRHGQAINVAEPGLERRTAIAAEAHVGGAGKGRENSGGQVHLEHLGTAGDKKRVVAADREVAQIQAQIHVGGRPRAGDVRSAAGDGVDDARGGGDAAHHGRHSQAAAFQHKDVVGGVHRDALGKVEARGGSGTAVAAPRRDRNSGRVVESGDGAHDPGCAIHLAQTTPAAINDINVVTAVHRDALRALEPRTCGRAAIAISAADRERVKQAHAGEVRNEAGGQVDRAHARQAEARDVKGVATAVNGEGEDVADLRAGGRPAVAVRTVIAKTAWRRTVAGHGGDGPVGGIDGANAEIAVVGKVKRAVAADRHSERELQAGVGGRAAVAGKAEGAAARNGDDGTGRSGRLHTAGERHVKRRLVAVVAGDMQGSDACASALRGIAHRKTAAAARGNGRRRIGRHREIGGVQSINGNAQAGQVAVAAVADREGQLRSAPRQHPSKVHAG